MLFDAIVLAGGRSSRLGTASKSELIVRDSTLLQLTLDAVSDARHIVVVGPQPNDLPRPGVRFVREHPAFGGPAAGIAAGLTALRAAKLSADESGGQPSGTASANEPVPSPATPGRFTLVLACDMPGIGAAVPLLLEAAAHTPTGDGAMAVDGGREQPLAAVYSTARLADAVGRHERDGTLTGLGVFRLIAGLECERVAVPAGSTDDVDTWADAARLGAAPATSTPAPTTPAPPTPATKTTDISRSKETS